MLWHQARIMTFPSSKGPGLSAIMTCIYPSATSHFYGLTFRASHPTQRMVTRENCSLFPQPLATLVTHFPVTVSHSWGLINYLWPEIIWPRTTLNCLSHNIILSPVSGGFPKNYLFRAPLSSPLRSGLDWLLTPSPAYPSTQLCSWIFPRPLYEGLLSKS